MLHVDQPVAHLDVQLNYVWADPSSLAFMEQSVVDTIISFLARLGMLAPCTIYRASFSPDGNAACLGCALAELLRPEPESEPAAEAEAAAEVDNCSICLEPVLNSDVTFCCDKKFHSVCATGVRPSRRGVRTCPLCRSPAFAILSG